MLDYDLAKKLFNAFVEFDNNDWVFCYNNLYLKDKYPEYLVLLHPDFYTDYDIKQENICGNRVFPKYNLKQTENCMSAYLWGYDCTYNNNIESDHLYPYSFGGITSAQNQIYLCKKHNELKGNDYHLYPFHLRPDWIDNTIKSIYEIIQNK